PRLRRAADQHDGQRAAAARDRRADAPTDAVSLLRDPRWRRGVRGPRDLPRAGAARDRRGVRADLQAAIRRARVARGGAVGFRPRSLALAMGVARGVTPRA